MVITCSAGQPSAIAFWPQRVLPRGRLGVGQHLAQRGLPHIQVRRTGQMRGGDLARRLNTHRGSPPRANDGQRHRGERFDEPVRDTAGRHARDRLTRRHARSSRDALPGPQPGHHAAMLQHTQPAPPAGRVAGQRAGTQLLVTGDVVMVAATRRLFVAFIAGLRFWVPSPAPVPAPPNAGAQRSRTGRRSTRPTPSNAAPGRPRARLGRRPPPRR